MTAQGSRPQQKWSKTLTRELLASEFSQHAPSKHIGVSANPRCAPSHADEDACAVVDISWHSESTIQCAALFGRSTRESLKRNTACVCPDASSTRTRVAYENELKCNALNTSRSL
mmetsp:Transcript_6408/g.17167  ORF Transcript_6408/g.17167 Transcript_6408/m.17167 type:complete len:115 (+) Transcript_6408:664-1008(+)